jgi:glutathione S-transferase
MIKVWGRPTSIHTQRVLWAIADADVPYELTLASATMGPEGHVSKGGAPFGIVNTPAYRAMNPNGTVPTIDDDGFILWESNAILTWVALKYAPQMSGDAQHMARAVQWMGWTNGRLEPLLHTLVMELVRLPEPERDPAKVEQARLAMVDALGILEARLAGQPYVAGDRFTIGDIPPGQQSIAGSFSTWNDRRCPISPRGKRGLSSAGASSCMSLRENFISRAET